MIEEIKDEPTACNCIVRAFENNPISILHENINDKKVYYFKASDIGKVLDIVNIRTSIINFDEDEKVVRTTYSSSSFGNPDTIFLTSQGVYRLLYNSKKDIAKKFRKWTGAILDDIIFNESKELQKQLEEQKLLLEEKQKELSTLKRLKANKWYNQKPGDTVYAIKVNDIIKIGKTKDIRQRERSYTENQVGDMFYIKKCYNCDLTEKVIHHMLDKHREENNKEWFNISNELAIYTIDIVCDFLDNFIDISEKLPLSNIKEYIDLSYKKINPVIDEENNKKEQDLCEKPSMLNKVVNIETKEDKVKRFIEECCEEGDNNFVLSYELFGAYRIWAKGLTNTDRTEFSKIIKKLYKSRRKYYKEYDSSLLTYLGIKPKDLKIVQENENVLPKYEEFILTECKYNYNYRMSYTTFIDAYKDWCSKKYPEYSISKQEQFHMDAYINRHFLKEKINMPGYRNVVGIWGFQLKSDNEVRVGKNLTRSKEIVKIDIDTRKIVEEYESLEMASVLLKLHTCTIRRAIRRNKIINENFILKYKENLNVDD